MNRRQRLDAMHCQTLDRRISGDHIRNHLASLGVVQRALIANLSAGFGIERRAVQHQLAVFRRSHHGRFRGQRVIPQKLRRMRFVQFFVDRIDVRFLSAFPTGTRLYALPLHVRFKIFQIDGQTELARHLVLLVQRQAVRVVELKRRRTRQHSTGGRLRFIVKYFLGNQKRSRVPVLFFLHDARHSRDALHHLRIRRLHPLGHKPGHPIQERIHHPDHPRVAHRPPHDLAQHITAAFVRWNNAVLNQKRGGSRMVGADPQHGADAVRLRAILHAEEVRRVVDDRADQVRLVVAKLSLHDGGDAFKPHACIDGRPRQRRKHTLGRPVKLHEYQIPDFDKPATAIERKLFPLAAALRRARTKIEVNLRTRAARTGVAHLPKIVLLVQPENAALRNAGHFLPEHFRVVIFAEHGDVQLVFRQAVFFSDQVPGVIDRFGLEVISKRKIAQHFKESVMAPRVSHILQVVVFPARTHALLRCSGARVVAFLLTEKHVFKLIHACVGEQQRWVVGGNQRRATHHAMVAGREIVQKLLANLMACHLFPSL